MASKSRQLPKGIYRSGTGFLARISHDGQQSARKFSTVTEAQLWLAEKNVEIEQGCFEPSQSVSKTAKSQIGFVEYAEMSIARRNLSPKSLHEYETLMRLHLLPVFGKLRMRQVTRDQVTRWYDSFDKNRKRTREHSYALLSTIFKHALEDDVVSSSPCVVRNGGRVSSTFSPQIPDVSTMNDLIDAMGTPKYRVMCEVAAWCGLRMGELFALRVKHICAETGDHSHILVQESMTWVKGVPEFKGPKSRAGFRKVPIPPHIRKGLCEYLDGLGGDPEQLLFASSGDETKPMRPATLYKVFYPARKKVGMPKLRWHDLRHFAATQIAVVGATTRELMTVIGHSTPNAAMRYQHATSGRLELIAERMSEQATKVIKFPTERATGA